MPEQYYRAATYRARDSMGYLLRRVYSIMHERVEAAFAAHDLTLMQWIILIHLRDGLARTASDIAREFRHDSGALTRVIDRLERRDLVARRRSRQDRRVVELELTPAGHRMIESLLPAMVGQMNQALAPFDRGEIDQMRGLLQRMIDHLQSLPMPKPAPVAGESKPKPRRQPRPAAKRR
jgi:DNA-binding MarR family transcriptional regulator